MRSSGSNQLSFVMPAERMLVGGLPATDTPVMKKRKLSGSPLLITPTLVLEQVKNVSEGNPKKFEARLARFRSGLYSVFGFTVNVELFAFFAQRKIRPSVEFHSSTQALCSIVNEIGHLQVLGLVGPRK